MYPATELIDTTANARIDPEWIQFRAGDAIPEFIAQSVGVHIETIGGSREGQALYGVRFGEGLDRVSVIAGCHADEPIGPMTAQALPEFILRYAPDMLQKYSFRIIPNMNPDGAERNRPWFANPPDLTTYIQHAVRELPGDDIEFGFGDEKDIRPECRAAQEFFRDGAPYRAHFSLHGMAYAEGAWCLINQTWSDRADPFMIAFEDLCRNLAYPQHDIDRRGEKGFHRIRRGYCTMPNAPAMRTFFESHGDRDPAQKFHPSSMEWIASLGGDPLCIVSEIPLFTMGNRSDDYADPLTAELKDEITAIRTQDPAVARKRVAALAQEFALEPTPLELQMRLQFGMIVLALTTLFGDEPDGTPGLMKRY